QDDKGWSKKDACQVLEEHEWKPKNPTGAEDWSEARLAARKVYDKLAHTSTYVVRLMERETPDMRYFPIVPTPEGRRLKLAASQYTIFAWDMVVAIATALQEQLPDDGAWSQRQRQFIEQYEEYAKNHP